jgi:hypothetical protein
MCPAKAALQRSTAAYLLVRHGDQPSDGEELQMLWADYEAVKEGRKEEQREEEREEDRERERAGGG